MKSSKDSKLLAVVPIENLFRPSTSRGDVGRRHSSIDVTIIAFIKDHALPMDKEEAQKLRRRVVHFIFYDEIPYKRGFSSLVLQCIEVEHATHVL